jgi:phage replication initiation protein
MTRPSKRSTLVLDGNTIKVRLEADRLASGNRVHVDWLRFTSRLRNALPFPTDRRATTTSIWDEGYRLNELFRMLNNLPDHERSAAGQASELADRVAQALGPDYQRAPMLAKGHDFYKHRWSLLRNGVECGWVGFLASSDSPRQRAQAETLHVNLFGTACTFAQRGWRERIAAIVDELDADITRCDLALDFFEGYRGGIERVWSDYSEGLCNVGGHKPKLRDINWLAGAERSLYIGSKKAGKETNVYEKGDQLFGVEVDSDWLRFELRYGNKLRVIDSDILRRPDDFFAGASEWHAAVLSEAGAVAVPAPIQCTPRLPLMTVEAEVHRNLKWNFSTAAASVAALFKYGSEESFLQLVSKLELPGRLRKFSPVELKAAFAASARA